MVGRSVVAVVVIVIVLSSSGCLENPVHTISDIPQVLVDYVNNMTKIYVRGFGDIRYSNISIETINNLDTGSNMTVENDTYYKSLHTYFINFTLHIVAWDQDVEFEYWANFTVAEVDPIYTIYYDDRVEKVNYDDLPIKTAIKEVKKSDKKG